MSRDMELQAGDDLSRRLKAARALADLTTAELASLLPPGLGVGPIKAVEQGRRGLSQEEALAIEAACGVEPGSIGEADAEPGVGISRHVRAARCLGGFASAEALAAAIDARGLGVGTIRAIERGAREPSVGELKLIAAACDVPLAFLSPSFFERRSEDPDTRRLEAKLDALMRHLGLDPEAFA